MDELLQNRTAQIAPALLSRSWEFPGFLDGERRRTFTAAVAAVAWVPTALFSAFRARNVIASFFTDYAYQAQFLIILPVLIVGGPKLNERFDRVAHQLGEAVAEYQLPDFAANWVSFNRLRNSTVVRAVMLLMIYVFFVGLARYLSPPHQETFAWWRSGAGFSWFSIAGTWAVFISYPILVYFTLQWVWRQFLWTRFMRATARLDLPFITGHADNPRGLGFLLSELRGQSPFSLCMGLGWMSAVGNRVLHDGERLGDFGSFTAVFAAAVLLICVAPYLAFSPALTQMRRTSLLSFDFFARTKVEHSEKSG